MNGIMKEIEDWRDKNLHDPYHKEFYMGNDWRQNEMIMPTVNQIGRDILRDLIVEQTKEELEKDE